MSSHSTLEVLSRFKHNLFVQTYASMGKDEHGEFAYSRKMASTEAQHFPYVKANGPRGLKYLCFDSTARSAQTTSREPKFHSPTSSAEIR